jgi:trimethylamine--corrinoid protein Co-methyltransferase
MNHLTACLGKVGLAPFVGGNFDSLVFSPAFVVYSDEVIRRARDFEQGFNIDDESVALDDIESVGAGGNFLMSDATFELCRKVNFRSSIWPNLSLDQWQTDGRPSAVQILRRHTRDLLNDLPAPEDHSELIASGESFIREKWPEKCRA